MKALLDIPTEINQTLNIIKAQMNFKNKVEVISYLVKKYEEDYMEPEIRPEYAKKVLARQNEKRLSFNSVEEMKNYIENTK